MKLNLLKYKILLDNQKESVANKISNYQKYGFNDSDLVGILFALTDEILIYGYDNIIENISYILIEKIEKELKNYINKNNIIFEEKIIALLWLNIISTYFHNDRNYYDLCSKITILEKKIEEQNEDIQIIKHNQNNQNNNNFQSKFMYSQNTQSQKVNINRNNNFYNYLL